MMRLAWICEVRGAVVYYYCYDELGINRVSILCAELRRGVVK